MKKIFSIFLLLFLLLFASPVFAVEYPGSPEGYVNDYAEVISPSKEQELEDRLSGYESSSGNEIAVVTIDSLEGITVEEYAVELFEKWGIGKAEEDNGVLFLIAIDDREMRIEVGYGLEGDLTDAQTKLILENKI